jgi:hypothetical protein
MEEMILFVHHEETIGMITARIQWNTIKCSMKEPLGY